MESYFDYLNELSLEGLKIESTTISRTPENKKYLIRILKLMAEKLAKSKSTKEFKYDQQKIERELYQSISGDYHSLRA